MTSAQFMQPGRRCRRRFPPVCALAFAGVVLMGEGCGGPTLTEPATLTSPLESPQIWAVAPFLNESGVSEVRTDRVADLFMEQIQQVEGLDSIPVNRVIAAMRTMEIDAVRTPAQAHTLMRLLGTDGLIVGTVTAYDPYRPPKLGLAIQLYHTDGPLVDSQLDPHALTRASTDQATTTFETSSFPSQAAAGVFDARHHDTLTDLQAYAAGRTTPDSAFGPDIYLASMELYTQFVSYRLIRDLLYGGARRISSADGSQ